MDSEILPFSFTKYSAHKSSSPQSLLFTKNKIHSLNQRLAAPPTAKTENHPPQAPFSHHFLEKGHKSQILQFIPLRNPRTIGRLIAPLRKTGNVALFDIEDIFWAPGSPLETQKLKIRASEQVKRFCAETESSAEGARFGIRVNPAGSDCFTLDLEVVKTLWDSVGLQFQILHKVESAGELETCRAAHAKAGTSDVEIIPIIESPVAFDQIDRILAACRPAGVRRVLYGHHDYSLDAGHWPVSSADTFEYWEIIGFILRKIEAAGLNYIQLP